MSHTAIAYAKHLTHAPDGSRITASEKAVLLQLADDHNDKLGVAWPSMVKLARLSCLSPRHTRRIIENLERKKILRRIPNIRKCGGGQTSNEYQFLALPNPAMDNTLVENRRKFQTTPRLQMTARPRPERPAPAGTCGPPRKSSVSAVPGHQRPPIEPSREHSGDSVETNPYEQIPPTPLTKAQGRVNDELLAREGPEPVFNDLTLARAMWTGVMEELRTGLFALAPYTLERREGFNNGWEDWKSFRFNDVAVEEAALDHLGVLALTVSSPDANATERGFAKYRSRITLALGRWYGCQVQFFLIGFADT